MNTKRPTTEQEEFWAVQYADEYVKKNRSFDQQLGTEGWAIMLRKAQRIDSYLECGCNIGRNLSFLARVLPYRRRLLRQRLHKFRENGVARACWEE